MLTRYFDRERFVHSIKTVIACMFGLLLTKIISFPADQWIIITIIVVMCAQIYVGGVLQKSYLRFLGTILGCLFAAVTIATVGVTTTTIACVIALSAFVFSYMATSQEKLSYAGTLGGVTTTIIMLGQTPTLLFAFERFLEISVGLLIATLVSQFILPIHARTQLYQTQARALRQLRDYYQAITTRNVYTPEQIQEIDEQIVKSLLQQRQLAKDSKREPLGMPFDPEHFNKTLIYERELLRAITFMHNAVAHMEAAKIMISESPAMRVFNQRVLEALQVLINITENGQASGPLPLPAIKPLKQELQKLKLDLQQSATSLTPDDFIYLDGFLFCAEILIKALATLAFMNQIALQTD